MTVETIPLPEDRIAREEPFRVRVRDLYAWPDQQLRAAFEFNPQTENWIWELRHTRLGRLWPKGRAVLGKGYTYHPYIMAKFLDTSGRHEHVTTENLGRDVVLAVFPGPLGGSFHPDAGMGQREEDRFLGRDQWREAIGGRA